MRLITLTKNYYDIIYPNFFFGATATFLILAPIWIKFDGSINLLKLSNTGRLTFVYETSVHFFYIETAIHCLVCCICVLLRLTCATLF